MALVSSILKPLKSFADANLWLDALYITGGVIGSDMLNGVLGRYVGFLPGVLQPFIGPAAVIAISLMVGDRIGRGLKLGAFVHAASTVLGMVGLPGVKA